MAADVLIAHASKRGSTEQVARGIGEVLRGQGFSTKVETAAECRDLEGFRAVVLGGSIYFGHWHHDAYDDNSDHDHSHAGDHNA